MGKYGFNIRAGVTIFLNKCRKSYNTKEYRALEYVVTPQNTCDILF